MPGIKTKAADDYAFGLVKLRPGNPIPSEVTHQLIRVIDEVAFHCVRRS
jgi:hypothetical protein